MADPVDFTSADFALAYSPDLLSRRIGRVVPKDVAIDALRKRLVGSADESRPGAPLGAARIARLIVDALPPELFDEGILLTMDLRPFVQVLIDNPDKTLPGDRDGQHITFTPEQRLTHMEVLNAEETVFALNAATANGIDPGDATARATSFDPTVVGVSPSKGGNLPAAGANPAPPTATTVPPVDPSAPPVVPVDPNAVTDADGKMSLDEPAGTTVVPKAGPSFATMIQSPTWDPEEFRELAKAGLVNLDQLAGFEEPSISVDQDTGQYVLDAPFGPMGVKVTGLAETPRPSMVPRETREGVSTSEGRGVGVVEAANFLKDMDEDEVAAVQSKMEAAGYLTAGEYDKGNAWDEATESGWRSLIFEAWQRNTSTSMVLAQQAQRRKAQDDALNAERVVQARGQIASEMPALDTRTMNDVADEYAFKTIGRVLTNTEKIELFEFMHAKRKAERENIAGLEVKDFERMGEQGYESSLNEGGFTDVSEPIGAMGTAKLDQWRAQLDSVNNVARKRFANYDEAEGERPPVIAGFRPTGGGN